MFIEEIVCRAQLEDDCYHGSLMSRQIPADAPECEGDPPLLMSADGTYDGRSIVCDACYVRIMPLTRSGAALEDEIPAAISHYRQNVSFLREQDDPSKFVEQARSAMEMARPGSPYHESARAMMGLAQAEVERRAAA